jgi:hypothetical protein
MNLMKAVLCSLSLLLASHVPGQTEAPEEIIVIGKQPGPPLWKITNGENALWIFGTLSPLPKDMVWDSQKVATVIANSREYLLPPNPGISLSKLVMLNPVNIVRGVRLAKRLARNADDASLAEILDPDLYQRFAVLKARYFPDDYKIESLRPMVAGDSMVSLVRQQEGLQASTGVMKEIRRLVRRNRGIKTTEIEVRQKLDGNYRVLATRAETFMSELSTDLEQACFAAQLEQLEKDIDGMKRRANAWAAGYVDELRSIQTPHEEDPCDSLLRSSTEFGALQALREQADTMWLDAAQLALNTNESTFAVLPIESLLSEEGLFAKLKARGYEFVEP